MAEKEVSQMATPARRATLWIAIAAGLIAVIVLLILLAGGSGGGGGGY